MSRQIFCPYCHATLYRLQPRQFHPDLSEYVDEVPLVESGNHGTFTTCFRCTSRVLLAARTTSLGVDAFELAYLRAE